MEQLSFDFNAPIPELPQLWTPDDIFNSCNQEIVELFKEDGRVEKKAWQISQQSLSEYLCMWANTQPSGGVIIIGVDKGGAILGCKDAPTEHLNKLETARRLCPDARHEFKRIAVKNNKGLNDFVIVVRVFYHETKLVETVAGDAFIREGEEKRRLTEGEKREIRMNKGELDCESEPSSFLFPDDFDIPLMQTYMHEYVRKRRLRDSFRLEDILILSKLGTRASGGFFKPNLACSLLFAKDPRKHIPGAFIRFIRYGGNMEEFGERLNSIADQPIEGSLPKIILAAEEFIDSQIRSFTRLGSDGRFSTLPEYPKEVWLEAIVNAVVHRSYNLKYMNIFVKMYENRLVVESPGSFLPPTTPQTVYESHNPRNPHLMWALYYFDFVKCAFEGTRRMRQGMRDASLPEPLFEQKRLGSFQVQVTLQNDVEHRKAFVHANVADIVDESTYLQLSDQERMIINCLVDKRALNVTEAVLILDRDWKTAKAVMERLFELKIVERQPGKARDRHRKYYLKGREFRRR